MPIPADEFESLMDDRAHLDLSPQTTQGTIYRFLLGNADQAFRQREIVSALDVPAGSVGPTLARLEKQGLLDHRGPYWRVADVEHAVASAGALGAATADEIDGGVTDDAVAAWMESAVDPIETPGEQGDDSGA